MLRCCIMKYRFRDTGLRSRKAAVVKVNRKFTYRDRRLQAVYSSNRGNSVHWVTKIHSYDNQYMQMIIGLKVLSRKKKDVVHSAHLHLESWIPLASSNSRKCLLRTPEDQCSIPVMVS